jgi:hypothetical protein
MKLPGYQYAVTFVLEWLKVFLAILGSGQQKPEFILKFPFVNRFLLTLDLNF